MKKVIYTIFSLLILSPAVCFADLNTLLSKGRAYNTLMVLQWDGIKAESDALYAEIKALKDERTILLARCPIPTPAPTLALFTDSFERTAIPYTVNGFGWNGSNTGAADGLAISSDIARTGTRSLKFTFAGGTPGDSAWSELRYILGYNMQEVYFQFYQYYPSGKESPTLGPRWLHRVNPTIWSNNKFFKLWADSYASYTVATGISTINTSDGHDLFFVEYGTNQLAGGVDGHGAKPNFIANDSHLGRWLKIQIHIKCATAANNDGAEEMWVDDVRVMSNTNLPLYPAGGIGNYFRNGYLMGFMNSGFSQTTHTYIDDVKISDKFIQ